jgi:cytochrome c6
MIPKKAFKKNTKLRGTWISGLLLVASFVSYATLTPRNNAVETGKEIFEYNCARCHGTDGTKGKWGAKNLKLSSLSNTELIMIISKGKGMMPAWNQNLTTEEIELVKDYVKILRK